MPLFVLPRCGTVRGCNVVLLDEGRVMMLRCTRRDDAKRSSHMGENCTGIAEHDAALRGTQPSNSKSLKEMAVDGGEE